MKGLEIKVSNITTNDTTLTRAGKSEIVKRVRFDATLLYNGEALITSFGFLYDHFRNLKEHAVFRKGGKKYYLSEISDTYRAALTKYLDGHEFVQEHLGPVRSLARERKEKEIDLEGGKVEL